MRTPATSAAPLLGLSPAPWRPAPGWLPRLVATGASLAAAGTWRVMCKGSDQELAAIPCGFLLVAAFAIHIARPLPQVMARAAWWATFVLAVVVSTVSGSQNSTGAALVAATGTALLLTGGRWLERATDAAPRLSVRARRALTTLAVLAFAEVQSLVRYGAIQLLAHHAFSSAVAFALATALAIVLVRVALRVSTVRIACHAAVAAVGIGAVALDGLDLPWQLAAAVGVGLALQLGACAVLARAAREDPRAVDEDAPPRALAARIVVAMLMVVAIGCAVTHTHFSHL